jgi:hypothetical protein
MVKAIKPKKTVVDIVKQFPGLDGLDLRTKGWNPVKHGSLKDAEKDGLIVCKDGGWHVAQTETMTIEQCGYCGGSGRVPGPQYDREGRHRPEWPGLVTCEYCGGSGQCEDGSKLLPASRTRSDA